MNETVKMMEQLITEETEEKTLEELAENYKDNLCPTYLATAFCKLHKSIRQISNNYFYLTEADIASFSLERLDFALQTFDDSQSKFITYFYILLQNKFREETQKLNTQKRKINNVALSYDYLVENGFEYFTEDEHNLPELSLKQFNLTNQETDYCELLMKGYDNASIAEILSVSVMTLCNMRKRLRAKINVYNL